MKGKLRLVSTFESCETRYLFERMDGESINVDSAPSNTPLSQYIEVQMVGADIVSWEWMRDIQSKAHDRQKNVALVAVIDPVGDDQDQYTHYMDRTVEEARELEWFLSLNNDINGYWEHISVTPYVVENHEDVHVGLNFNFNHSWVRDQLENQNPDYNQHNYWHGRGGHAGMTAGEAYYDGYKGWTYQNQPGVMFHEFGHNLRCHHTSTENNEYGGPTCIMAQNISGFCAPQLTNIRQLSEEALEQADGAHFIAPAEISEQDLREGETKIVIVDTGSNKYALSTRKTDDQNWLGLRASHWPNSHVYVHKVYTNTVPLGTPQYKTNIPSGETLELEGVNIQNVETRRGVTAISIDDAPVGEFPQPLEVVPGDEITENMSRIWHDPRYGHQGLDLTIHGDRATGYWFGYHPDGEHGTASMGTGHNGMRWLSLHGHVRDGYIEFDIQSVLDGEPRDEGTGTIRFDENSAHLRWDTIMYGREHYRLEALSPPKIDPQLYSFGDYSGVSVAQYDNPQTDGSVKREAVVYYYGPGLGGQDWSIMMGRLDDLTVFSALGKHRSPHADMEQTGEASFTGDQITINGTTYDADPLI